jgi:ferric-dicitrate binding protein FerR (iron transport regulator)
MDNPRSVPRSAPHAAAPMPDALQEALRDHADGAELQRVWELLPMAESASPTLAGATADERESLWARIAAETTVPEASAPAASAPAASAPAQAGDGDGVISLAARRDVATAVPSLGGTRGRVSRANIGSGRTTSVRLLAAAAAVMLSVTWALRDITTSTAPGESRQLTLADGSQVRLSGSTTIEHPRWIRPAWLGGSRQVRLDGVAFFDVAKDAARPFVVTTDHATVTVRGTRFNVVARGTGEASSTDVAVEEGVIEVRRVSGSDRDAATLRANDRIRVSAGSGALQVVASGADVARETAWIRGGFSAVDLPFTQIVTMLEAQFGVEIRLSGSAVSSQTMTVYYPTQRAVDAILLDLCTARGLVMRRTSRGFEITPKP